MKMNTFKEEENSFKRALTKAIKLIKTTHGTFADQVRY
jgi:hypothetical protein